MDPTLIAALHLATTFGFEVNNVVRLDKQGEHTQVSLTVPGASAMTSFTQGFNCSEMQMAAFIVSWVSQIVGQGFAIGPN